MIKKQLPKPILGRYGRIGFALAAILFALGGVLASLLLFPQAATAAAGPLCYVDAGAAGGATGDSWADAYLTVQDALADPNCAEIWVAAGVYYPDEGAGQTDNARASTFQLASGVALYGGFDGTETQRIQRDPAANVTVLSGDIDKNDTTDINGVVTDTANINGNNAYHVVTGSGTDNTAVLDGFTITAGQANGTLSPNDRGGGMFNSGGSPALSNVTFSGNSAAFYGGGMSNSNSGSPVLTGVTFATNSAGNRGGGMYNVNNSNPILNNTTFISNTATEGGGMLSYNSDPALINVTFSGNAANNGGGGMHNWLSSPTLTDVTFTNNTASTGGGIQNYDTSNPTLTNVTFSANSASSNGGGIYNTLTSNPVLTNVTFSGNSAGNNGGGIANSNSNPVLTNVTFSANSAGNGGGMYNDNNSTPLLTNVTFSTNSASNGGGGGMFSSNSNPVLTNVTFSANSAGNGGSGGGMFNNNSNSVLTNVTFSGNSASTGGGTYNDTSNPTLTNVTFSGNSAGSSGGGIYNNNNSSPTLTNTIIANSTGRDCVNKNSSSIAGGSANNLIEDTGANACGLTDDTDGNIIGQNPRLGPLTDFGGPGRQVHPLLPGSPAIDAGTACANCPADDQRGMGRPVGAAPDIGAYELDSFSLDISKSVDNPTPSPGQTVTFTIVVTNTGPLVSGGLISDTLPAGLNFLGPITLAPAGAGTVGAASPALAANLTISANQRVTVTFPVTVSASLSGGTQLTNTAAVSATQVVTPVLATAGITTRESSAAYLYLPVIVNNGVTAPNLVVDTPTAGDGGVMVRIRNRGNAAVTDPFRVALYLNPDPPPPAAPTESGADGLPAWR